MADLGKSVVSYWRKGEQRQNFGDLLSDYLVSRLFLPYRSNVRAVHVIGSVLDEMFSSTEDERPTVFWGCGLRHGRAPSQQFRERTQILSVRGPLSLSTLSAGSLMPSGDPAFLLPAFHTPVTLPRVEGKTACIPHFHDARPDDALLEASECDLVLRPNIENVESALLKLIDAICSADFVLSASLHGCIVAAAYGRPFAYWDPGVVDLPFKWEDLAASMGIPAVFAANLEEGRHIFRTQIAPTLKIPDLAPSLVKAPLLLRAAGLVKVLAWQGRTSKRCDNTGIAELDANADELERGQLDIYNGIINELNYWSERAYQAEEALTAESGVRERQFDDLAREAERLAAEAARDNERRLENAISEISKVSLERDDLRAELSRMTSKSAHLEGELSARTAEWERAGIDLQVLRVEVEALRGMNALVLALEFDLKVSIADREQKNEELRELVGRCADLQGSLDISRAELGGTSASLEAATRDLEAATRDLVTLNADYQRLTLALKEKEREIADAERVRRCDEQLRLHLGAHADWLGQVTTQLLNAPVRHAWLPRHVKQSRFRHHVKQTGLFDGDAYLAQNPDVAISGMDPLHHYVLHGRAEGRPGGPPLPVLPIGSVRHLDDPELPLGHSSSQIMTSDGTPSAHVSELVDVADFDGDFYLSRNPDVAKSGMDPLRHYVLYGRAEGRSGGPRIRSANALVPSGFEHSPGQDIEYPEIPLDYNDRRIVIIDGTYPTPTHDSGSVDAVNFIDIFQKLGYAVYFVATANFSRDELDSVATLARNNLAAMGVHVIDNEYSLSVAELIRLKGGYFNVFFLSRIYAGGVFFEDVRRHAPDSRIIFNTVDLHGIREMREGQLEGDRVKIMGSYHTAEREHYLARLADATIVVSSEEARLLRERVPGACVFEVPLLRDVVGTSADLMSRRDIGFIGGYRHTPNIDAVRYFLDEIWPLVRADLPDVRFQMIGADLPDDLRERNDPGLVIVGHVADLQATFDALRLSVAPLRIGAGAKGKVVSSLCHGLPCVATPIAIEGMGLEDCVLVAGSPDAFARAIVRLYTDDGLWRTLSDKSLDQMRRRYSIDSGINLIKNLLRIVDHKNTHLGSA